MKFKFMPKFLTKLLSGDSKEFFRHRRFREVVKEILSDYLDEDIEGVVIFNGIRISTGNNIRVDLLLDGEVLMYLEEDQFIGEGGSVTVNLDKCFMKMTLRNGE